MGKPTTPPLQRAELILRAFSNLDRLRILHLLQGRELSVSEIGLCLLMTERNALRHLQYLHKAGLVVARRIGRGSFYSLAPAQGPLYQKTFDCLASCFLDLPEIQVDLARHPGPRPRPSEETGELGGKG